MITTEKSSSVSGMAARGVVLIVVILTTLITNVCAVEYYVNNQTGSDSNPGTSASLPWKSIAKVEATVFAPGDIINFARGSVWTKAAWEYLFIIDDNGTASQPIIFRAYGTGDKPVFSNGGNRWNSAINIRGKYIIIEDFHVTNTGNQGFTFNTGADNNIVRNCEVSNTGVAFMVRSSNNLFTRNYIHDLKMVVNDTGPYCSLPRTDPRWNRNPCDNDFGATSFWFYASNNEISYNRLINNIGDSYDYEFDGGFIELYDGASGINAHHNWVDIGNGIVESSNGTNSNIRLAYNVFIENKGLFAAPKESSPMQNFRFENNTCITRTGTVWDNMLNWYPGTIVSPSTVFVRNNIFVLQGDSDGELVTRNNNFTHTNNLYYLTNGASLGSLVLHESESLGDPLFVNEAAKDFRLQGNSPAKNAGANLGYTIDFNGDPVPSEGAPDLGAFEFQATPPSTGQGLTARYYNNIDFTGSIVTRVDPTVNFSWANLTSPAPGIDPTTFSVIWDGFVKPQYSGTYTFFTRADDGIRLWVDGRLLVDNYVNQSPTEKSGTISLTAGRSYVIQVQYYNNTYGATAQLSWSHAQQAKQIIPQQYLEPAGQGFGLWSTYFDNIDLTGAQVGRMESTVNFNWGTGSPAPSIGPDSFSARWSGQVKANYTDTYTFYTNTDDGVRLWVNNSLLVDRWVNQGPTEHYGTISLVAGQKYNIIMEYYENAGGSLAQLSWSSANQPKQIIPAASLYPTPGPVINASSPSARMAEVSSADEHHDLIVYTYPNPARDFLTVSFYAETEGRKSVELNTINQVAVSTKVIDAVKGNNTVEIDVRGLQTGLYILHVKGGFLRASEKVLIVK